MLSLLLWFACRPTPAPPQASVPPPDPAAATPITPAALTWTQVAPGVEHAWLRFDPEPKIGANRLDIVRLDPNRVRLSATLRSAGQPEQTAQEACGGDGSVVVTNLGMFHPDGRHVGWTRHGEHVDQPTHVDDYRSWLLAGPRAPGLPAMRVVDSDGPPADVAAWTLASQNLRLIAHPGRSVWKDQPRRWSEAALGQDSAGRLLLLHTRAAWTMAELNAHLLTMPLGLVAAMHLEGGPEASLSICTPSLQLHVGGGYESGFSDDTNTQQWPLPNLLRVTPLP
jgi:hypothetical protein